MAQAEQKKTCPDETLLDKYEDMIMEQLQCTGNSSCTVASHERHVQQTTCLLKTILNKDRRILNLALPLADTSYMRGHTPQQRAKAALHWESLSAKTIPPAVRRVCYRLLSIKTLTSADIMRTIEAEFKQWENETEELQHQLQGELVTEIAGLVRRFVGAPLSDEQSTENSDSPGAERSHTTLADEIAEQQQFPGLEAPCTAVPTSDAPSLS